MFDDIRPIIGILALVGVWYGLYRALAWNSEHYLQLHSNTHQEIVSEAMACADEGIKYIVWNPHGWYELTALGHHADQAEIETYTDRLRDLYDKIQTSLLESPGPWRFRFAARRQFNDNIRRWLAIRGVCTSIVCRLTDDRNPSRPLIR